jgi:hypothetical protein
MEREKVGKCICIDLWFCTAIRSDFIFGQRKKAFLSQINTEEKCTKLFCLNRTAKTGGEGRW